MRNGPTWVGSDGVKSRIRQALGRKQPFLGGVCHRVRVPSAAVLRCRPPNSLGAQAITGRLAVLGSIATNIVYSSPLPHRDLTADLTPHAG